MRTLIQEYASALACPRRPPCARIIIRLRAEPVGDDPVDPADRTEFAGFDQLLDFDIRRNAAQAEHGAEFEFRMRFGSRDKTFRLGFLDRNRFFHKNMNSMLHRPQSKRDMEIMRRGNNDAIHLSRCKKRLTVGKQLHTALPVTFQNLRVDVAESRQFTVFQLFDTVDVSASHHADTDNSDSDHRHSERSFSLVAFSGFIAILYRR